MIANAKSPFDRARLSAGLSEACDQLAAHIADHEVRAGAIASALHAGQLRKYDHTPYINHPRAVAALVATVPHTQAMLCAAWLHDVVEDTPATLAQVSHWFGDDVAALVDAMTDVATPAEGNRATRKARYCRRLAAASAAAQTIKFADLLHNLADIERHDHDFATVFRKEALALVTALTEGDAGLRQRLLHRLGAVELGGASPPLELAIY